MPERPGRGRKPTGARPDLVPVWVSRRAIPHGITVAGLVEWCGLEDVPAGAVLACDVEYDEQGPEIFAEWEVAEGTAGALFGGFQAQSHCGSQSCYGEEEGKMN